MARVIVSRGTVASSSRGVPAISAARRGDEVDLLVVGVAVAAVAVVAEEHVGLLLGEDLREALGGLLGVGPHEAGPPGRVRLDVGAQPAVGVTEVFDPRDPEGLRAALQLGHPGRGEGTPGGILLRRQAETAVGRDDEDDPVPLRRGTRHRPRREEGLVVGVRVESEQREGHVGPILTHDTVFPVKVALLSDCYLPRLGGIEVQTHDLAPPPRGPRARGRGVHGDPWRGRRDARGGHRRRRRPGPPARGPDALGAAGQPPGAG